MKTLLETLLHYDFGYHVTARKNLNDILKHGIKPYTGYVYKDGKKLKTNPKVYFWKT